jgi:hypothetical protein
MARLRTYVIASTLAIAVLAPTLSADARALQNYRLDPNELSPQYLDGTCVYRAWYGNYGSTPFVKLRFYSGNCASVALSLLISRGAGVSTYDGLRSTSGGTDSCGSYIELQETGPAGWVGVGEVADFYWTTGHLRTYRYDATSVQSAYHYC